MAIRLWLANRQSRETWAVTFLFCMASLAGCDGTGFFDLVPVVVSEPIFVDLFARAASSDGEGCLRASKSRLRWVAVAALLLTGLAGLPQYYAYRSAYQEWRDTTDYIVANERTGDGAMFCVAHGRLLFDYYRDKEHPNQAQDLDLAYPDLKNEMTDPRALSYFPPLSAEQLNAILTRHRRIWYVLYPDDWAPGFDTSRMLGKALAAHFSRVEETHRFTVTIRLYSDDADNRHMPQSAPEIR